MLSQTVEYSLRAIVWLASHPDDPQTNQQIANATLVPAGYLSKVMQSLGRGGLVTAQRGKRGAYARAVIAFPHAKWSVETFCGGDSFGFGWVPHSTFASAS